MRCHRSACRRADVAAVTFPFFYTARQPRAPIGWHWKMCVAKCAPSGHASGFWRRRAASHRRSHGGRARNILIAFNVNLATADITIARADCPQSAFSSGGLPHVKALGLRLPRGIARKSP